MTPGERLVVAMAEKWVDNPAKPETSTDLIHAIEMLRAERITAPVNEMVITYGQLVAGDEIRSESGRWFGVRTVVSNDKTGVIRVWLNGMKSRLERPHDRTVLVKRSEMGAAVDMFASVMWSGQAAPEPAESKAAETPPEEGE